MVFLKCFYLFVYFCLCSLYLGLRATVSVVSTLPYLFFNCELEMSLRVVSAKYFRLGLMTLLLNHRRAVAQPCVNGDRLSQWKMAKFDPAQIRNPSTDRHKI